MLGQIQNQPDDGQWSIDRATGEVISAEPFGFQNVTESVDLKSGRIKPVAAKTTGFKTTRDMCSAPPGAKDWQPSAFSPQSGWLYIPHNNLCYEMQGVQANYIAGTPYVGATVKMYAGHGGIAANSLQQNATDIAAYLYSTR